MKHKYDQIVFASLLCLIVVASSMAQQREVRGIVKDAQNREQLPNATIMVKGSKIGTKTNAEGYFVLHIPRDSVVILEFKYIGYASQEIRIGVDQTDLVIKMRQVDIQLGQVEVVGNKPTALKAEREVSLSTISPEQLKTLPSVGQADIFRSLQLLPGIGGTDDKSSGLYVRGGTPDQNLVLLDGMTVYHVDHLFGFFSAFNPDAVKDVQLYKGGFPAKYGGRLSSVVDMSGKVGDPDKYHFSIGANFLSANAMLEIPLWKEGSVFISGRRSYADILGSGLYNSLYKFLTGEDITSGGPRANFGGGGSGMPSGGPQSVSQEELPKSYFDDLNTKITYSITPIDILSTSFYKSSDQVDKSSESTTQSIQGMSSSFTTPGTTDINTQGNLGYSVKWFHQWGTNFFSNVLISNATYTSSYEFGSSMPGGGSSNTTSNKMSSNENNRVNDLSVRWDNEWYFDQYNEMQFGGQVSSVKTSYTLNQSLTFSDQISPVLTMDERALQSSVYAQNLWKGIPVLDVNYGLRVTHYDATRQVYVEPRLSLRYSLTENIALKCAYGIYHQYVTRIINENLMQGSRDFWVVADRTLLPSCADHYILGASWENEEYLIDVEAYYKNLFNLVEFSQRLRRSADDKYSFFSGTGVSKGVDILLQKKEGMLTGWISYTLGSTMRTFPEINSGKSFPSSEDQTHELKLVAELSLGDGWSMSSNYIYGSGKPYTSPVSQYTITLLDSTKYTYTHISEINAYRLPEYHRWDVSCSYRFGEKNAPWIIGVTLFNVLNRKNVSYYKYDLSTQPMTITSVTGLGFTPTLFVQITFL
jgi:ferric enterobactin receptor